MALLPWRPLFRLWPVLLFGFAFYVVLQMWDFVVKPTSSAYTQREDWISVRLSHHQKEYSDRRGVHVVVGHYIGSNNNLQDDVPSLTEEILNANQFAPRPGEGRNGQPVVIPSHEYRRMQQLYQINRFNLLASDRIPLNRTLPDVRKNRCQKKKINLEELPATSVIIVFHNEAWSTLLRTVHSVINRSPHNLLEEIILVDDASTRAFLREPLEEHVTQLPVKTRVLRAGTRVGLVKARLIGARQAQGKILTFLDAHCECTIGWLENLLERVAEDRTRVVCPVIDIISDDNFAYIRSFELHWGAFNWELHFRWYTLDTKEMSQRKHDVTLPFRTPVMAGGLFTMDKSYFFDLGAYDKDIKIWGGENLELSFRVWQCGGSVEIAPCSHVGHLFRKSSPYSFPGGTGPVLYSNLARVALVWMDEWKEFYFKFNPEAAQVRGKQSVRSRMKLRERLKCKNFEWYLDNVWPQHFMPKDDRFFGKIISMESGECLQKPSGKGSLNQLMGSAALSTCVTEPTWSILQMFVMTSEGYIMTDESVCLDAVPDQDQNSKPRVHIMACNGLDRQKWTYSEQTNALTHNASKMCLELPNKENGENHLVLNPCSGFSSQRWQLQRETWK